MNPELAPAAGAFAIGLVAGAVPFGVGAALSGRWRAPGVAAGIALFLFVDWFALSAGLGAGLRAVGVRTALLGILVAGAALGLLAIRRGAGPALAGTPGLWVAGGAALAWTAGAGLHGLGEGVILGRNLHLDPADVFRAFPVASFLLHKLLEGAGAGLLAPPRLPAPIISRLALVVGLPLGLGALAGHAMLPGILGLLAFAAGAGVLLPLWPALAAEGGRRPATWTAGALAGLLLMYLAGLLHEW